MSASLAKKNKMFCRWIVGAVLAASPAIAIPLVKPRSDDSPDAIFQKLPVSNFQDISSILSLLAGDTVEKKLSSESNFDWERMSSVWCVFGLVGALRANLKIATSISGSERAGVELFGAAGFTARQTANSLCYWKVGRLNSPLMWRDSTNQILSRLDASNSPWVHPLCVAVGYSRCPWDWAQWQCILEILVPTLWTLLTMTITILPTLILMPSLHRLGGAQLVTLGVQAATACLAGSLSPLLLHRLNSFGLAHLTQLTNDRYQKAGLIKEGDHIVTSAKANVRHIIWQTPLTEASPRSGDYWTLRLLCSFSAVAVLGAYLSNYIAISNASGTRQYAWFIVQVLILTCRYILWARRPVWFPQRHPCLLYIVCGSLGTKLAVDCSNRIPVDTPHSKLDLRVLEFACASACSKQLNWGSPPWRIRREVLLKLANIAPADIIYSEYTAISSHYDPTAKRPIEVIRLSWAFIEELYLGQGIVLGSNPWALGGLYLGAVLFQGRFLGLTTLHPFTAHTTHCTRKQCTASHNSYQNHTITLDGYLVSDDTYGEVIGPFHKVEDSLLEWHYKFRDNVDVCRRSAKSNGPSHIEIRASAFGPIPIPQLRTDVTRTQPSLDQEFVKAAVKEALEKSHQQCHPWICEIDTFGDMRPPKQKGNWA